MEKREEEERSTGTEDYTDIETKTNSLNHTLVFHVVHSVLGFLLYMHQQIPSVLQDITLEFDSLRTEYTELETQLGKSTEDVKASFRRQHVSRMREVKLGVRRLQKFMTSISGVESALQLIIREVRSVDRVILVVGPTPIRPLHVYEFCFSQQNPIPIGDADFTMTKAAQGLSRKAIRALISKGAGSGSHPGPTKLFLLVKAPSSLSLPLHFLPKRDFKYSKKIVPLRLRFKCKSQDLEMDAPDSASQTGSSISLELPTSNDFIWFQCRHVVKGLAFKTSAEE